MQTILSTRLLLIVVAGEIRLPALLRYLQVDSGFILCGLCYIPHRSVAGVHFCLLDWRGSYAAHRLSPV